MYNDNLYVLAENPNGGNPRLHFIDLQQNAEQGGETFLRPLDMVHRKIWKVGNFFVVSWFD